MAELDFRFTSDFIARYESLDDETCTLVDRTIVRLIREHSTAWARQGRVAGEMGEAWIIEVRMATSILSVYWDYLDDHLIVLLLLIVR